MGRNSRRNPSDGLPIFLHGCNTVLLLIIIVLLSVFVFNASKMEGAVEKDVKEFIKDANVAISDVHRVTASIPLEDLGKLLSKVITIVDNTVNGLLGNNGAVSPPSDVPTPTPTTPPPPPLVLVLSADTVPEFRLLINLKDKIVDALRLLDEIEMSSIVNDSYRNIVKFNAEFPLRMNDARDVLTFLKRTLYDYDGELRLILEDVKNVTDEVKYLVDGIARKHELKIEL